jgi:opacity protein-like surface antigen
MIDADSVAQTQFRPFRYVFALLVTMAAAAAAMAFVVPTKARAQGLQTYFGVNGGYSHAFGSLSDPSTPGFALDGLGFKGFSGGVHGGVDMQLPASMFFVGVFGGYTWQKVDFAINPIATARLGDAYTAGVRTGFKSGKSKYFVGMGYAHAEMTSNISGLDLPSLHGLAYTAGTTYEIAPNLLLGGEVTYTHFNKASVMGLADLQVDQLAVKATLSIQLGTLANPVLPAAPLK